MLYLQQATQGTHNPWGGYSLTWCDTKLTDTGHSHSGRLPLTYCAHNPWGGCSLLWGYTKPMDTGRTSLRQATHYIGRTQSMRWLLLSTTWGSTLGSGLWCKSVEKALTFATQQQTNDRPWAQAHNGFYRDLSLTDDWLICLSCDHTWCCHPVVGNIPFAP